MASTSESVPVGPLAGRLFYCHRCTHQWRKLEESVRFVTHLWKEFCWKANLLGIQLPTMSGRLHRRHQRLNDLRCSNCAVSGENGRAHQWNRPDVAPISSCSARPKQITLRESERLPQLHYLHASCFRAKCYLFFVLGLDRGRPL